MRNATACPPIRLPPIPRGAPPSLVWHTLRAPSRRHRRPQPWPWPASSTAASSRRCGTRLSRRLLFLCGMGNWESNDWGSQSHDGYWGGVTLVAGWLAAWRGPPRGSHMCDRAQGRTSPSRPAADGYLLLLRFPPSPHGRSRLHGGGGSSSSRCTRWARRFTKGFLPSAAAVNVARDDSLRNKGSTSPRTRT
jgi:hypothetical protein